MVLVDSVGFSEKIDGLNIFFRHYFIDTTHWFKNPSFMEEYL